MIHLYLISMYDHLLFDVYFIMYLFFEMNLISHFLELHDLIVISNYNDVEVDLRNQVVGLFVL
jgi:hypothetical protein